MFQNYSQTFASQILALAGFVVLGAKSFGYDWAQEEVIFVLGLLANIGGIVWALVHRHSKGDVTVVGVKN